MALLTKLSFAGRESDVQHLVQGEGIVIEGNVISAIMNATNTYTKVEIDELLGDLEHLRMQEVSELPATGESNIIYLVPKTGGGYEMYVWDTENNDFVDIGGTDIDLANYVTTTAFNNYNNVVLKTLWATGWTLNGTVYEQTLTFTDIYDKQPSIVPCGAALGSLASDDQYAAASGLKVIGDDEAKTMTFYASVQPTVSINLAIQGVA